MAAGALLTATAIVGCGSQTIASADPVPPDSAPPAVVLDAYLKALRAGDCATARALATQTFRLGNGELCGALQIVAYAPPTGPATPPDGELIYATTLTTRGGDRSMPDGHHDWFYSLIRQPSGAWRLVGGGTGP